MTMGIRKLVLTTVLILATASASVVGLHAHASRRGLSSSPHIKLRHAGGNGNNITSTRNGGFFDFSIEVKIGPVWSSYRETPEETYIKFMLFRQDGSSFWQRALSSDIFETGALVPLIMGGDGWSDPCRLIVKSDDGWRFQQSWYVRWVSIRYYVDREERSRTFAIDRWIGPEEFDSFLEVDSCSYASPDHNSLSSTSQLHAGGNNITRNERFFEFYIDVQIGPVWIEQEIQEETHLTFMLFRQDGSALWQEALPSDLFQTDTLVQLNIGGDGWSDPCRLIVKSDDGWHFQQSWYIQRVSIKYYVDREERSRTFDVDRWIGPEQFDSFLEVDNCNYGVAPPALVADHEK